MVSQIGRHGELMNGRDGSICFIDFLYTLALNTRLVCFQQLLEERKVGTWLQRRYRPLKQSKCALFCGESINFYAIEITVNMSKCLPSNVRICVCCSLFLCVETICAPSLQREGVTPCQPLQGGAGSTSGKCC